jgi:DNA-binding transcriptional ArsR family regulator
MLQAQPGRDPFEALGDPNRCEIVRLLSSGDKPVHEIAAALPISRRVTVSAVAEGRGDVG